MPLSAQVCYRAVLARDAQFDGQFIVGVTSTGIYCRPVCRVKTPKAQNCRFFADAVQAQLQGFRPCRRCRPELAPAAYGWSVQDVSASLAAQALRLLDPVGNALQVQAVAARLGITDRHLRRIVQHHFGYSPHQYLQQKRLTHARQLLMDTVLPVQNIARASGYQSVRAFHTAFAKYDGRAPLALRAQCQPPPMGALEPVMRLSYRPPYQTAALLGFLARRAILGVEWVHPGQGTGALASGGGQEAWHWIRSLALEGLNGLEGQPHPVAGWVAARLQENPPRLHVAVSANLLAHLPALQPWVAAQFDLNAAPAAIASVLGKDFAHVAGLRVPGCMQAFELVVRAILGQQISVAAANTLLARFANAFGQAVTTPFAAITHQFPTAQQFANQGTEVLERMGAIGIIRSRQNAIAACAQALADSSLVLNPGAPVQAALQRLLQVPGIGPWTAHYIVMRSIKWPDAFVAGDAALHKALGLSQSAAQRTALATTRAQAWQPWRSYAVMASWQTLE